MISNSQSSLIFLVKIQKGQFYHSIFQNIVNIYFSQIRSKINKNLIKRSCFKKLNIVNLFILMNFTPKNNPTNFLLCKLNAQIHPKYIKSSLK